MGYIPTAKEVICLQQLAQQLRASAADTNNNEYVELFLKAAMALEKRACGAAPETMEYDRYMSRH